MISDADSLSRSASQHDADTSSCLRDQSSCSSMTSGLGHSDQSICNEKIATTTTTTTSNITQQQSETNGTSKVVTVRPNTKSAQTADLSQIDPKLRSDIKKFVDIIFTNSQSISLEKKAEFGQLARSPEGRLLFAVFVDDYRVNSKRVSELTFYSLAQYFSIVLLECLLAEDFRPAKIIMNMMFTYYHEQNYDKIPARDRPPSEELEANNDGHKTVKTYLYTLLKDQEIFKSIRFWTSAFYESVIIERNNHSVFVDRDKGKLTNERRNEESDCSKNITFGLLGSFIHNMCLLDLSHEFCQEFLDKHSTIAGLSDDQLEMLRYNLKSMFAETSMNHSAMSQASTYSEKLANFMHKLSTKLNQAQQARQSSRDG